MNHPKKRRPFETYSQSEFSLEVWILSEVTENQQLPETSEGQKTLLKLFMGLPHTGTNGQNTEDQDVNIKKKKKKKSCAPDQTKVEMFGKNKGISINTVKYGGGSFLREGEKRTERKTLLYT